MSTIRSYELLGEASFDLMGRTLRINTDITEECLVRYQHGIENHIIGRIVDTLYEELMPVLRERVLQTLSAERLAEILTGEISMAIKDALNPGKK